MLSRSSCAAGRSVDGGGRVPGRVEEVGELAVGGGLPGDAAGGPADGGPAGALLAFGDDGLVDDLLQLFAQGEGAAYPVAGQGVDFVGEPLHPPSPPWSTPSSTPAPHVIGRAVRDHVRVLGAGARFGSDPQTRHPLPVAEPVPPHVTPMLGLLRQEGRQGADDGAGHGREGNAPSHPGVGPGG